MLLPGEHWLPGFLRILSIVLYWQIMRNIPYLHLSKKYNIIDIRSALERSLFGEIGFSCCSSLVFFYALIKKIIALSILLLAIGCTEPTKYYVQSNISTDGIYAVDLNAKIVHHEILADIAIKIVKDAGLSTRGLKAVGRAINHHNGKWTIHILKGYEYSDGVVMHEVLHTMGRGHNTNKNSVMNRSINPKRDIKTYIEYRK